MRTSDKYRYMKPLLNMVQWNFAEHIPNWKAFFEESALRGLEKLYYDQLSKIGGSTFFAWLEEQELPVEAQIQFWQNDSLQDFEQIWQKLFKRYPILARKVSNWNRDFETHVDELVQRVCRNYAEIANFLGEPLGRVKEISINDADVHNGRCVHIIRFENGSKIVYKPRSLQVDVAWGALLEYLAERGKDHFKTPKIFHYENYGFVEFIEHRSVDRPEDITTFYRRCGFLLGIVYTLQGSDFHAENLIAAADCPVLIDLETITRVCDNTVFSDAKHPQKTLYVHDSVTRTNMLPFLSAGKYFQPGNDSITGHTATSHNLPHYQGVYSTGNAYTKEICEGFSKAYEIILQHREFLTEEGGLLSNFRACEIRVLLRNTSYYYELNSILANRENLGKKALENDKLNLLDKLYDLGSGKALPEFLQKFREEEKEAIRKGYIPRLLMPLDIKWPYSALHQEKTIYNVLCEKLFFMNGSDKVAQCRFIRATLELYGANCGKERAKTISAEGGAIAVARFQLNRLMETRLRYWEEQMEDAALQGIVVERQLFRYYVTILPARMTEGVMGLLIPLAYWYKITKSPRALGLINSILLGLEKNLSGISLSAYGDGICEGIDGLLLFLEISGKVVELPILQRLSQKLLDAIVAKPLCPMKDWEKWQMSLYYGESGTLFSLSLLSKEKKTECVIGRINLLAERVLCCLEEKNMDSTDLLSGRAGSYIALLVAKPDLSVSIAKRTEELLQGVAQSQMEQEQGQDYSLGTGQCGRVMAAKMIEADRIPQIVGVDRAVNGVEHILNLEGILLEGLPFLENHSLTFGNAGILFVLNLLSEGAKKESFCAASTSICCEILGEWEEKGFDTVNPFSPQEMPFPSFFYGEGGLLFALICSAYPQETKELLGGKEIEENNRAGGL